MKSIRKLLFWLHLSGGVAAGLILLVLSVTGLLLVYQRQIMNWLEAPVVLQDQNSAGAPMALETLLSQCLRNGQGLPAQLELRNDPNAPVIAHFDHERILFLNPWTADIVGLPSEHAGDFFSFVRNLHRSLGFRAGHGIVKFANLIVLVLLLSGLYLWFPKPFNRSTLRNRLFFVRGLKAKARHWNWHLVIGLWTLIPLLAIVSTGVLISYPAIARTTFSIATNQAAPEDQNRDNAHRHGRFRRGPRQVSTLPDNLKKLDAVVLAAKQQIPQWQSLTIQLPLPQDKFFSVSVDRSLGGQPEQVTELRFDQNDLHLLVARNFASMDDGHRFRFLVRSIHTGEEFGLIGQTFAALSCIGAMFLVWTAYSLAIRRYRRYRRDAAKLTAAPASQADQPPANEA